MEILDLKKWLEKPGNTKSKLAWFLDYKSTATVEKWLRKGEIPRRESPRVAAIIRGEKLK